MQVTPLLMETVKLRDAAGEARKLAGGSEPTQAATLLTYAHQLERRADKLSDVAMRVMGERV
jgi:hypothetical protein